MKLRSGQTVAIIPDTNPSNVLVGEIVRALNDCNRYQLRLDDGRTMCATIPDCGGPDCWVTTSAGATFTAYIDVRPLAGVVTVAD